MTLPHPSSLDHPLTYKCVALPDDSSLDHPLTGVWHYLLFSWPSPYRCVTLPDASSLDHPLTHSCVTLPDASSLDHLLTHSCDITWCLFSWPSPNAQLCDITWQSFSVLAEVKLQHLYQGSTPPHPPPHPMSSYLFLLTPSMQVQHVHHITWQSLPLERAGPTACGGEAAASAPGFEPPPLAPHPSPSRSSSAVWLPSHDPAGIQSMLITHTLQHFLTMKPDPWNHVQNSITLDHVVFKCERWQFRKLRV